MHLLDFGGRQTDFTLIKHHFERCNGLIYVVDINNFAKYEEAIGYLKVILSETDLNVVPLLILLNKNDIK